MSPDAQKSSVGRKVVAVVLFITTLVSLAPIIGVIAVGILANSFGCRVDEAGAHPCAAFGTDIGHILYTLGVLGWLMLITVPTLIFAIVGWIVLFATRPRAKV